MSSFLPMLYLSPDDVVRIVQRVGLSRCITGVAERIERDFLRWPQFDKSARVACHSRDGVIELMPIADEREFAFKYVNGHPKNTQVGLPTVMAFGVLADVDTGTPRLLSELTLTTAIRTAAMSAVAARSLARPECRTMALIGNGAQSEFQAVAFRDLVGIRTIRVYDVDPAATAKLVANLVQQRLEVVICNSAKEAVQGVDIVTTVTADKVNATILTPDMVTAGMHVNAVGGDCPGKTELHSSVLEGATVFVEYEPQTRIEGDIQQMSSDFPVTELWRVLSGQSPGRSSASEVTVFDSVGFALEDYSALTFIRDLAQEHQIGRTIELVPTLSDPKNLFGAFEQQRDRHEQTAFA
ncbi:ornithine cyclodeaminase [Paraburkholderia phytofirmans OLGA172]|uniref:Ornithine cyclodeaminase n=1 Tax=Paraburkholderia phytofirmans OLGA172 TaxID=1417228 RepID=A0A160FM32_9BURK|nr:ornithine cyclodeaminase [Paraburkholderia phytofirmans]ANB73660.1 ornithine cyclodeaminase [Paraburkholderia phytofirmans OLGA172]